MRLTLLISYRDNIDIHQEKVCVKSKGLFSPPDICKPILTAAYFGYFGSSKVVYLSPKSVYGLYLSANMRWSHLISYRDNLDIHQEQVCGKSEGLSRPPDTCKPILTATYFGSSKVVYLSVIGVRIG